MSGWRNWSIGELVEAADFQSFVQDQVVQVYDDASDRTTALGTAVAEGMLSYLKDTNAVEVYDATGWVAVGGGGDFVSQTNGFVTTANVGSAVVRNVSFSTATPGTANGMDGDVWLVYTP